MYEGIGRRAYMQQNQNINEQLETGRKIYKYETPFTLREQDNATCKLESSFHLFSKCFVFLWYFSPKILEQQLHSQTREFSQHLFCSHILFYGYLRSLLVLLVVTES